MISPEFRTTEAIDQLSAYKQLIISNHGESLWQDLEPEFNRLENNRKEMVNAFQFRTDANQLRKYKELFLENYRVQIQLGKFFAFGTDRTQVNLTFNWQDSFTRQKIKSNQPLIDAISSLYNYGVACARIVRLILFVQLIKACYMDLSGDGIKEAMKQFQQAGWVFEHCRTLVSNLGPNETSPDFASETLGMLANLMLAQAQYLFYKKATDSQMKPQIQAKIAMQVGDYFKKSYEIGATNASVKNYDKGVFLKIQSYYSIYFLGISYLIIGKEGYKQVADAGQGIGKAISDLNAAISTFEGVKSIISSLPQSYQDNFNSKLSEAIKLREQANNDNKTIYFEKEIPLDKLPRPDSQNLVKYEPPSEDIDLKISLQDKLRFIVPPQIRVYQEELRQQISEILNHEYELDNNNEQTQKFFMDQHHLPQALYSVSAPNEIPDQIWDKVEEFQKRGGIQTVMDQLEGIKALKQNNIKLLDDMKVILDEEEGTDFKLRQQYGEKWIRTESVKINGHMKFQVNEFKNKAEIADKTDEKIETKFKAQIADLDILKFSRQQLSQQIPGGSNQDQIQQSHGYQSLQLNLQELDKLKERKQKIFEEAIQKSQNLNVIDDMTQVHQGLQEKGTVFEKYKQEFRQIFSQLETIEKQRMELNQQIEVNMHEFNQIKAQGSGQNSETQDFYRKLDGSLQYVNELNGMLAQANNFHSQLCEHLNKIYQDVMDFKMSRDLEKNDMVQQINSSQVMGMGGPAIQQNLNQPPVQQQIQQQPPMMQQQQPNQQQQIQQQHQPLQQQQQLQPQQHQQMGNPQNQHQPQQQQMNQQLPPPMNQMPNQNFMQQQQHQPLNNSQIQPQQQQQHQFGMNQQLPPQGQQNQFNPPQGYNQPPQGFNQPPPQQFYQQPPGFMPPQGYMPQNQGMPPPYYMPPQGHAPPGYRPPLGQQPPPGYFPPPQGMYQQPMYQPIPGQFMPQPGQFMPPGQFPPPQGGFPPGYPPQQQPYGYQPYKS
ncbi:programmed cell death 6-interacting protein [Stylonychia lemnae]|uniref:Programmed cell death 6-interacting protein n=1 Tax=Stylonychia lemnae TaxID=5949 RepID=A0A078B279_STYLE|nr:programmed cell death 6-interacting protein [Stylonychia lemnae]|eukprot:CDW88356.1 programmed cell death 6-interacting protein [Stylonychia lemnae]